MPGDLGELDVYIRVLSVMNPFTAASVFLTVTESLPESEARRLALKSLVLVAFLGGIVSLFGRELLSALGISVAGLSFGGGILLLVISVDMITGAHRVRSVEEGELGIVPLAIPVMFGPGLMTLLIHLSTVTEEPAILAGYMMALATVGATVLLAHKMKKLLGLSGIKGLARIVAIIIAGVAGEMIHRALLDWGIAKK